MNDLATKDVDWQYVECSPENQTPQNVECAPSTQTPQYVECSRESPKSREIKVPTISNDEKKENVPINEDYGALDASTGPETPNMTSGLGWGFIRRIPMLWNSQKIDSKDIPDEITSANAPAPACNEVRLKGAIAGVVTCTDLGSREQELPEKPSHHWPATHRKSRQIQKKSPAKKFRLNGRTERIVKTKDADVPEGPFPELMVRNSEERLSSTHRRSQNPMLLSDRSKEKSVGVVAPHCSQKRQTRMIWSSNPISEVPKTDERESDSDC